MHQWRSIRWCGHPEPEPGVQQVATSARPAVTRSLIPAAAAAVAVAAEESLPGGKIPVAAPRM